MIYFLTLSAYVCTRRIKVLLLLLQNLSCQFSGKLDCFKYQGPLIAIIMVETLLTGHYSEKALMFVPLFKGYTYTGTERLSMTLFDFFFFFRSQNHL